MSHDQSEQKAIISVSTAEEFERELTRLRPELHRYCARMTGSVIEGEDALQTTFIKALEAFDNASPILNFKSWLFRIAHNCSIDMYRDRDKQRAIEEELTMRDDINSSPENHLLTDNLQQLMHLPTLQRSVVLFRELFGYSAAEIAELLHTTPAAIKSALSRARESLKQPQVDVNHLQQLSKEDLEKLALIKHYTELFNQRQFDDIRSMLRDEVQLDMVNKARMNGKQAVSGYYNNYAQKDDWYMEPGLIEGKPAVLAFDKTQGFEAPRYFILLEFESDTLRFIRDFRYADYVMQSSQWQRVSA